MLGINHFACQTGNSQALSPTALLSDVQRTAITSLTMGSLGGKPARLDSLTNHSQPSSDISQFRHEF